MTLHAREQIIEAAVLAVTGLSTTGSQVYQSRVDALERANLPSLTLGFHPATETVTPMTMPLPRRFERRCRFQVLGDAREITEVATRRKLNTIALEVEKALAMPTVVGPWKILTLLGTEIDLSGAGEAVAGQVILTYEALYYAAENAPDVAL